MGGKAVLKSRLAFGLSVGQMMMHVLRQKSPRKEGKRSGWVKSFGAIFS